MGDLIQRLPTDEICLSDDENSTFRLLFGQQKQENKTPSNDDVKPIPIEIQSCERELRKEIIHISLFFIIIFIITMPIIINIIKNYIPLCQTSWVTTGVVQSLIASFFIWFVINFSYSKK